MHWVVMEKSNQAKKEIIGCRQKQDIYQGNILNVFWFSLKMKYISFRSLTIWRADGRAGEV